MARPPIRAILWDIDGTLMDSEPWHHRAMIEVCRGYGHEVSEEECAASVGVAFRDYYDRLHAIRPLPVTVARWADEINALYVARVAGVKPREGAFALVEGFAARGLDQACVSNSGRAVVDANLAAMGLPHFRFSISRDDVANGKPHPEPYLRAAETLGLAPESCAVIEDSPTGARSARAAGMLTIAWPQNPAIVFDAVDYRVEDPAALDWDALCGSGLRSLSPS
ncbi:haloacid dehalogenase superfamily, subfamily IA, variant 3 with third motif having DD or ED [Azospirillum lipoferum]|nr:haloacid dehalogenase superfamily, subfamily IA, variant 3 with third motif having DD or ED [Azospirillum lipoferum]